jgi:pimeloyl-ACP methyl ester carboxylesterase
MTFVSLADGCRIRYSLRGEGTHTYVLIHGWRQSHRLFDRIITGLESEARVFAYDQRGMGESDKPNSTYDFQVMSDDLAELLEKFDLTNVTLVGWSMGCTTSLSYLKLAQSRVTRVILLNGPIRLTKDVDFPNALEPAELAKYIDQLESEWPSRESEWFQDSLLPKNHHLTAMLTAVGFQTPLDVALKLVREQGNVDHRSTIIDLTIPVLALYSRFDPYWPISLGEWIADNAPRGSLTILENSAHCAPLEEPENFINELRNFAHQGGDRVA